MNRVLAWTARRGAALMRDEAGAATIEFVVIFPAIMFFVLAYVEIAVFEVRAVMLKRGVDIAIREVRLGLMNDPSHDKLKDRICEHGFLLTNCADWLLVELQPIRRNQPFPSHPASCVDRASEMAPVVAFDPGKRGEIMLVRACMVMDPLFPGTGIGAGLEKDASGGYRLFTQTAFLNEPL